VQTDFQMSYAPPLGRVRITGELDLSTGEELQDVLDRSTAQGCTLLELDLVGVSFVDAHTLGILDRHQRWLTRIGGELEVVAASHHYLVVADLAGYDNLRPVAHERPQLRLYRQSTD
jgi:anti-anti-sigma factor